MALDPKEVRVLLDPETHRAFQAMSLIMERTMSDLGREAIDMYMVSEIRKAHAGKLLLRVLAEQGIDVESVCKSSGLQLHESVK